MKWCRGLKESYMGQAYVGYSATSPPIINSEIDADPSRSNILNFWEERISNILPLILKMVRKLYFSVFVIIRRWNCYLLTNLYLFYFNT